MNGCSGSWRVDAAAGRMMLASWLLLAAAGSDLLGQSADTVEIRDLRAVPEDVEGEARAIIGAGSTRWFRGRSLVGPQDSLTGDAAIVGGELVVEGFIAGRVVAIGARLIVRGHGRIGGSAVVIGAGLTTLDDGLVEGSVRVYPEPVRIDRNGGTAVVRDETEDEAWYRTRLTTRAPTSNELRLVTARTYNRVEGLPLLLGPRLRRTFAWGRLTIDAMGILRSAERFELNSENLGHQVRAEVEVGGPWGIRLGGQLEDVVGAVEEWHLTEPEVGLATFLLHRDYRDYYSRHGGTLTAAAFIGDAIEADISWSEENWGALSARDPWSLIRDNQRWRPNPQMDAGRFRVARTRLRYDTRNDREDPWSGWYLDGTYEYGSGRITNYAPTSPGVRDVNPTGATTWDRVLIDVRRYNRISAEGQLNFRLVAGGWLSGDELPLQRRFSLGSPGSLPGYNFRQMTPGSDYLTCADFREGRPESVPRSPAGVPAQCERMLLAQVEYRGEIGSRLLGFLDQERRHRRFGWGRGAEWVVFADAGRGWLVGPRIGDAQYGASTLPGLSTFRADVGIGLRLDDLGLYVAKSVTDPKTPVNFFARLRPRF